MVPVFAWSFVDGMISLKEASDRIEQNEIVRKKIEENKALERANKKAMVKVGITKLEFLMLMPAPASINTTTTKYGIREQFVYEGKNTEYYYFDNDILTTIQN